MREFNVINGWSNFNTLLSFELLMDPIEKCEGAKQISSLVGGCNFLIPQAGLCKFCFSFIFILRMLNFGFNFDNLIVGNCELPFTIYPLAQYEFMFNVIIVIPNLAIY